MTICSSDELSPAEKLNNYDSDLAAAECLVCPLSTKRQMETETPATIPDQYTKIMIVCGQGRPEALEVGGGGVYGRIYLKKPFLHEHFIFILQHSQEVF